MMTVTGLRVLLSGDVEPPGQEAIVAAGADLHADVLKVPHHGSARQDQAFLAATHARLAIASAGVDNDYGHPAPSTVARLRALGMQVLATNEHGGVGGRGTRRPPHAWRRNGEPCRRGALPASGRVSPVTGSNRSRRPPQVRTTASPGSPGTVAVDAGSRRPPANRARTSRLSPQTKRHSAGPPCTDTPTSWSAVWSKRFEPARTTTSP